MSDRFKDEIDYLEDDDSEDEKEYPYTEDEYQMGIEPDENEDTYSDDEDTYSDDEDEYYEDDYEDDEFSEEELEEVTKANKPLVLICIVASLVLLIITISIIVSSYWNKSKTQETQIISNYQTITTNWVKNFAEGELSACDEMVVEGNKIYSAELENFDYYEYALRELGKSIRSIEVSKDTEKENTYTITLKYNPFKKIDKLTISEEDEQTYKELEDKYVSGETSDQTIKEKIDEVYFNVYKSNCFIADETTLTEVLVLSEEEVNGITYVRGTEQFIDNFLTDSNLANNINFYEQQITQTITELVTK